MKFQNPPEKKSGRGSTKYLAEAAELRANPNTWALVIEGAHASVVGAVKTGGLVAFRPAGAFDATSRSNGEGRANIYICYVGEHQQ